MLMYKPRNVQIESMEILERAMNTIKHGGFINYYGEPRRYTLVVTFRFTDFRDAKVWDGIDSNAPHRPGATSVGLA